MLDVFKHTTTNQFEAAFCTLNACIERCPKSAWNAPIVNLLFCQVVFHTLFFADYYLGKTKKRSASSTFTSPEKTSSATTKSWRIVSRN